MEKYMDRSTGIHGRPLATFWYGRCKACRNACRCWNKARESHQRIRKSRSKAVSMCSGKPAVLVLGNKAWHHLRREQRCKKSVLNQIVCIGLLRRVYFTTSKDSLILVPCKGRTALVVARDTVILTGQVTNETVELCSGEHGGRHADKRLRHDRFVKLRVMAGIKESPHQSTSKWRVLEIFKPLQVDYFMQSCMLYLVLCSYHVVPFVCLLLCLLSFPYMHFLSPLVYVWR